MSNLSIHCRLHLLRFLFCRSPDVDYWVTVILHLRILVPIVKARQFTVSNHIWNERFHSSLAGIVIYSSFSKEVTILICISVPEHSPTLIHNLHLGYLFRFQSQDGLGMTWTEHRGFSGYLPFLRSDHLFGESLLRPRLHSLHKPQQTERHLEGKASFRPHETNSFLCSVASNSIRSDVQFWEAAW